MPKPKKDAVKLTEEKSTLAKAKDSVVKAAGKVAEVVTHAAEAVNEHVVHPVSEAVGIVKKPKKRFVREKVAKKKPSAPAKLATGSKKTAAKLMSKGIALPPKESTKSRTKPKENTKTGKKPGAGKR